MAENSEEQVPLSPKPTLAISTEETHQTAAPPLTDTTEIQRRARLLADYKSAMGNPSDYRIYNARNSGIYKPQFYAWKKGTLSRKSQTARKFELFLQEKKSPIPRKPET
jgi:hypothetical protein